MNYDDWKLETPEEEDYRLGADRRRERDRADWMDEHADSMLEEKREREEMAERYKRESGCKIHFSDCSTSIAPAEEPRPCDCDGPLVVKMLHAYNPAIPVGFEWTYFHVRDMKAALDVARANSVTPTEAQ